MRTPKSPPPSVETRRDDNLVTETRCYKVITPMFGGGVTPGEADPITTVRATEVRGHLRFWWRAVNGGTFDTVEDLKQHENAIWGSTEAPSDILVVLLDKQTNPGDKEVAYRVAQVKGKRAIVASEKIASYAAFPLQPDKDEQKNLGWESEPVRLNVSFVLTLAYPKTLTAHVQSALWAWETFGGIGARTRRGFGALQWLDDRTRYPAQPVEVKQRIQKTLDQITSPRSRLAGVPLLTPQLHFKVTSTFDDPVAAWKDLISALNEFRQDRYGKKYGLSKWPEANEIRQHHKLPIKLPDGEPSTRLVHKFPRAAFGLPIVFHMPHDRIAGDLTLEGVPDEERKRKYDRLASPLILRPVACAGGKYVGLAAILDAPTQPPKGLRLKGAPDDPQVKASLTQAEAKQIDRLNGNTDVLQAFLDWL
jgi:CRISPR-associated protein Cmr1